MMQELIEIKAKKPTLNINFEALKKALEKHVGQYNIVVSEDTVADAKKLATELNKDATELDNRRKAEIAKISEPIKDFDNKMKELVSLYKDTRKDILSQVERFEDETRELCKDLLVEYLSEMRTKYQIDDEFHQAEVDDLILISNVSGEKLAKKARDAVEARVREERALQDQTRLRLSELKSRSYEAGLAAPLTKDHVHRFLFAPEDAYEKELTRLMDVEIERQREAERRIKENLERERLQKEEAERKERERQKRMAEAARQEQTPPPAVTPAEPDPEKPQKQATDEEQRQESAGVRQEQRQEQPAPGQVEWDVYCVFRVTVSPATTGDKIEEEAKRVFERAGVDTLKSARAHRVDRDDPKRSDLTEYLDRESQS